MLSEPALDDPGGPNRIGDDPDRELLCEGDNSLFPHLSNRW
jgi:hypothetical protein